MDFNDVVDGPMAYTDGIWSINDSMLEYLCYCASELAMELGKPSDPTQKEVMLRIIAQTQVKNLQNSYFEATQQKQKKQSNLKLVKPRAEPQ